MLKSLRTTIIINLLSYGLILGGLIGLVLYSFLPSLYSEWYFVILTFFIVFELLSLIFVEKQSRTATDTQLLNLYQLNKVIKIIVSLFIITIIAITIKDKVLVKKLAFSFIALYFCFLAISSFQLLKIEKMLKLKKIEQQNER